MSKPKEIWIWTPEHPSRFVIARKSAYPFSPKLPHTGKLITSIRRGSHVRSMAPPHRGANPPEGARPSRASFWRAQCGRFLLDFDTHPVLAYIAAPIVLRVSPPPSAATVF